jgi:signal peptidase I
MFFLTPSYLKQAKLLHKGVTRFLHYKRDLLPKAKLDEITGLRTQLEEAMKAKDENKLESLSKTINQTCERAMPEARTSAIAENVEVFFVSIVIALGIRAYIAQPFQIPTGSMQPTLNGITAERTDQDPDPGIFKKAVGWVTGTTYLNAVSDHDGYVRIGSGDMSDALTEHQILILRPYCKLHFTDGYTQTINCPRNQLLGELHLTQNLRVEAVEEASANPDMRPEVRVQGGGLQIHVHKGQVLARGLVHDGDHVIVNKFSYNFRRPNRGEVFVFTTKNIAGISIPDGQGSQHYIKRLAGVPGDSIEIRLPQGEQLWPERREYWKNGQRIGCELWLNGKKATEPGFQRVMARKEPGYNGYTLSPGSLLPMKLDDKPGEREYLALGDNSANSSDGRYWGPVPEQNVVGPGWICYWPLTSHWGFIR